MKFSEIVQRTRDWLQREARVSYRALKREFAFDDESINFCGAVSVGEHGPYDKHL